MKLWHLLLAWSFLSPISGALASATNAKVGFGGYALAFAIGLGLGLISVWTMETVRPIVADHAERRSLSMQVWYVRELYSVALMWIVLGLCVGYWVTSALIRLVV